MKVNVDQTVEFSDAHRKQLATLLGKKEVNRSQIKDFLWQQGARWEAALEALKPFSDEDFAEDETNVNGVGDEERHLHLVEDEDLIGAPTEDEDLI